MFYEALHEALAVRIMPERALSPADPGSLTVDEENGIQAELELRADDESSNCVERFQDWLNSAPGQRARRDYRDWRVATATDDERRSILESL